jgi:hypothetical protein
MFADGGYVRPEELPDMPEGVGALVGGFFLVLVGHYILLAAYEATSLRWLIRGETPKGFPLSFAADTWRVWGVYWVWVAFDIVAGIASAILVGIVVSFVGNDGAAQSRGWAGFCAQLVALYFMLRLAPAAAASVTRSEFSFFEAWSVTRGRVSQMAVSFLILGLIVLACYALIVIAAGVAVWPSIGEHVAAVVRDESDLDAQRKLLQALFEPSVLTIARIAYLAAVPVIVFTMLAYFGICARAATAAADEGVIERLEK